MANVPVKDGGEEVVFQGKIIEVVRQPMRIGEKQVKFEFARRSPGTRLIIVDKQASKILLTKEYRTELQNYDYRLPGGKVFDTLDEYNQFLKSNKDILEPATERAKTEAREETGIIVNSIKHFYTSVNGATVVWDLFYFVIDDWQQADQQLEHGEDIEVEWLSFADAQNLAVSGKMSEDRSVGVLLRWLETNG